MNKKCLNTDFVRKFTQYNKAERIFRLIVKYTNLAISLIRKNVFEKPWPYIYL